MSTERTTAARIRAVEDTIGTARTVLEKAESALRGAERVAERTDEARAHPVRSALGLLALAGLVGFAVFVIRRRSTGAA